MCALLKGELLQGEKQFQMMLEITPKAFVSQRER